MTETQHGRRRGVALAPLVLAFTIAASEGARADLDEVVDAAPGGTLRVELDVGTVDIESHDEPEVQIDARAGGLGSQRVGFELEQDGDEILLHGSALSFWSAFAGGDVRVRARVPRRFSVDIRTHGGRIDVEEIEGTVRAHTTGGSIDIDEVEGDVDVQTTGGSIDMTEVEGAVAARTTGGTIRIDEVSGPLEARTAGGNIALSGVRGPVEAGTTGGSVSVQFDDDAQIAGDLETFGGSITIEVDEDASAEIDARATGGSVKVDDDLAFSGQVAPDRVRGDLGGGGERLSMRTTGGSISIRKR